MKIKFVHMPKCAGSSIAYFLQPYLNSNFKCLKHYKEINHEDLGDASTWVSCIRNPLDVYASFWAYREYGTDVRTKMFKSLPENCKSHIDDNLKSKKEAFRNWLNFVLLEYNFPNSIFENANVDYGMVTQWVITYWFGENKKLFESEYLNNPDKNYVITEYIRAEHIETDLKKIININEEIIMPRKNQGKEKLDYRELYDKEMMEMVYNKDRYIYKKFKYGIS